MVWNYHLVICRTQRQVFKALGWCFASSHVWMWELDHRESWTSKNWCFWTEVLEKTLESNLDCKIKPVNPKGNQSWIFIRRIDAEVKAPILWPPDAKNWLIGKDPDAGKDWRQEEKGMTEDEMVGWHHWLDGQELVTDREAWCAAVHGVTKNWTRVSGWTELNWLVENVCWSLGAWWLESLRMLVNSLEAR